MRRILCFCCHARASEKKETLVDNIDSGLYFIAVERAHVEKNEPHRILEYIGRTTPVLKKGNKWADLDAVTDFDYKITNYK